MTEYAVAPGEGGTYEVTVTAGGHSTLDGLTDVNTSGVADGDALVYDAGTTSWVPGQSGAVDSVNGDTGTVVLTAADVGADPTGTASSAVAGHVAAVDPHGDRAYAAGAASTAQAYAIQRANHTGTQTLATISDAGTAAALASDTDGTLAANSDTRLATQKAIKTYVDTNSAPVASDQNILATQIFG